MKLTGIIIFIGSLIGSLIGFLLWIYKSLLELGSKENIVRRFMGEKITLNILPGIILFIVMAISAGIAWG